MSKMKLTKTFNNVEYYANKEAVLSGSKTSCVIYVPKKYLGKKVHLIIEGD